MGEREIKTFLFNRRKELGLSQEYVAGLLDISVTSYRKIENGKTSLYNKKVLKLAEILDTSPSELLFGYTLPEERQSVLKEEYEKGVESLSLRNKGCKSSNYKICTLFYTQKLKQNAFAMQFYLKVLLF